MIKPDLDDFKNYFTRDFPYSETSEGVMDSDIEKALGEAPYGFSEALADDQAEYDILFLNYSAHLLVTNLRSSSQGIAGQYSFLQGSRSVGSVSESIAIPQRILDNPSLAMLAKTTYGAKFLQMILPKLTGQMFTVTGTTQSS